MDTTQTAVYIVETMEAITNTVQEAVSKKHRGGAISYVIL